MSGGARQEIRFEGAGVSPGMACAKIHVVRDDLDDVSRYRIAPSQVPDEIGRFETALIQTRMQILEMQQRIAESLGTKDAASFDAHLLDSFGRRRISDADDGTSVSVDHTIHRDIRRSRNAAGSGA